MIVAFTPWPGGRCPVPGDTVVEIRTHAGDIARSLAKDFYWSRGPRCNWRDVMAYRVISPPPA